jgi:hypothetical protein
LEFGVTQSQAVRSCSVCTVHSSPSPFSFWPRLASMNKVSAAAVTTISIVA